MENIITLNRDWFVDRQAFEIVCTELGIPLNTGQYKVQVVEFNVELDSVSVNEIKQTIIKPGNWDDYPRNWADWNINCPVDGKENDFEEEHELYTASYQIDDNTELLVEWCNVCGHTKEEQKKNNGE